MELFTGNLQLIVSKRILNVLASLDMHRFRLNGDSQSVKMLAHLHMKNGMHEY